MNRLLNMYVGSKFDMKWSFWQMPLDERQVDFMLISKECVLRTLLEESRDWHKDYEDDLAAIFVRGSTLSRS